MRRIPCSTEALMWWSPTFFSGDSDTFDLQVLWDDLTTSGRALPAQGCPWYSIQSSLLTAFLHHWSSQPTLQDKGTVVLSLLLRGRKLAPSAMCAADTQLKTNSASLAASSLTILLYDEFMQRIAKAVEAVVEINQHVWN